MLGLLFLLDTNSLFQLIQRYDENCKVPEDGSETECILNFELEANIQPPIYIYYAIDVTHFSDFNRNSFIFQFLFTLLLYIFYKKLDSIVIFNLDIKKNLDFVITKRTTTKIIGNS